MANPISSVPGAQIPPITERISGEDGTPTSTFYRFFTGLYLRTGGAGGVSANDAAQVANQALTAATQANQQSVLAQQDATQAESQVAALVTQVATANATANQALDQVGNVQAACLQRFNNLGDLLDTRQARTNIGLPIMPCVFQFDTLPINLRRGVPLVYGGTIAANLAGTQVWWNVATTANAVFTVSYVRNGVDTRIGTITLVNLGTGVTMSLQNSVTLRVGDTLVVQCPAVADATLVQVAFTIPLLV